jgi:hypothetical protein
LARPGGIQGAGGSAVAYAIPEAVNQFTFLVRKETQVARTEMSEKLADLAVGMGLLIRRVAGADRAVIRTC